MHSKAGRALQCAPPDNGLLGEFKRVGRSFGAQRTARPTTGTVAQDAHARRAAEGKISRIIKSERLTAGRYSAVTGVAIPKTGDGL